MAIRLAIQGINVECDTPQEVAALIRATKLGENVSPIRKVPSSVAMQDPGLFKPSEVSASRTFTGSHLEVLTCLREAFPVGVSSDQLAARIGGSRRSIPIILVSLQKYAEKQGLRLGDLIVREKPPRGSKGSSYRMTERGMQGFFS